jgi:hypothetical protein
MPALSALAAVPQPYAVHTLGDLKASPDITDHEGWIILNGRALSTLTASQQSACATIGIVSNLPDIEGRTLVGSSGTKALRSVGGNDAVGIAQANLPAVNLSGASHGHGITETPHSHATSGGSGYWAMTGGGYRTPTGSNWAAGPTSATEPATSNVTMSSSGNLTFPLGGSGTALDVVNPYVKFFGFIYLGA